MLSNLLAINHRNLAALPVFDSVATASCPKPWNSAVHPGVSSLGLTLST
jgi:hypothetical protein